MYIYIFNYIHIEREREREHWVGILERLRMSKCQGQNIGTKLIHSMTSIFVSAELWAASTSGEKLCAAAAMGMSGCAAPRSAIQTSKAALVSSALWKVGKQTEAVSTTSYLLRA